MEAEATLDPRLFPLFRRYEGEERRRPYAEYVGEERRVLDPPTEQDHPDVWGWADRAKLNSGSGQ